MANIASTTPASGPAPKPAHASPARPQLKRSLLLIGFAFAVMADPVSSVAYTIKASLRALNGHLGLLMPTQLIVLGIIALVDVNYWQLVGRYRSAAARPRPRRARSAPAGCSCRSAR